MPEIIGNVVLAILVGILVVAMFKLLIDGFLIIGMTKIGASTLAGFLSTMLTIFSLTHFFATDR